jgi:transposase IS116/IS110/IS902 family protein
VLKVWSKRYRDLGRARTQVACRLHQVLCELIPGGVPREITAGQAARFLESVTPAGAVEAARWELAAELTEDLRGAGARIRETRKKAAAAVRAAGTSLTGLFVVGPVIAAAVIGDVRHVSRFGNRDRFAAYNGTAPIEVSCGGRKVCRLSRRGNRRLNHAIHMAAVTQIRYRHTKGRTYYDKKLAEGKTPDVGTSPDDMAVIARHTSHVLCRPQHTGGSGDSSAPTAAGTLACIAAVRDRVFGGRPASELTFAIQGLGHVGVLIADALARQGATLVVADTDPDRQGLASRWPARTADPARLLSSDADILVPAALGGILTPEGSPIPALPRHRRPRQQPARRRLRGRPAVLTRYHLGPRPRRERRRHRGSRRPRDHPSPRTRRPEPPHRHRRPSRHPPRRSCQNPPDAPESGPATGAHAAHAHPGHPSPRDPGTVQRILTRDAARGQGFLRGGVPR